MLKKKPNKKSVVEFISMELEKGDLSRESVLAKSGKKWQIATRTFDRYWKEANDAYNKTREAIKEQLQGELLEAEKERTKKAILTKEERMEIASKIAKGDGRRVGKEVLIPSDTERIRALDYLAKVEGDYVPVKTENTHDFGFYKWLTNDNNAPST